MDKDNDISHKDIYNQVKANSRAIADLHADHKKIQEDVKPIREFVDDIDTAARFGRGVRGLVGWLVVVGGFVAMIYIVIVDAIKSHG